MVLGHSHPAYLVWEDLGGGISMFLGGMSRGELVKGDLSGWGICRGGLLSHIIFIFVDCQIYNISNVLKKKL